MLPFFLDFRIRLSTFSSPLTSAQQKPVHSIIVPGGGSAGFVAARTLKGHFLELPVRVIRSGYLALQKK